MDKYVRVDEDEKYYEDYRVYLSDLICSEVHGRWKIGKDALVRVEGWGHAGSIDNIFADFICLEVEWIDGWNLSFSFIYRYAGMWSY